MIQPLYNIKTIQKQFSNVTISEKQKKAAKEWLALLKEDKLEKEKENYFIFRDVILRDLLGYPEKKIQFERENVEFSVKDENNKTAVCFEAKGSKTKDLFTRQHYGKKEQENPVVQTMTDMMRFPASYGICTNYKDFVLLDVNHGLSKCHKFNFLTTENFEDKLKEFIGIFSYENLVVNKSLEKLYDKSVSEEREFTKEFYKLFHETRLMLIKAFQEKEDVSKTEAIYYTQIFLNRIIFMFFVQDLGQIPDQRLFSNRILKLLEAGQSIESSRKIYDDITELFGAFNNGSLVLGIFGYNGGLFDGIIPHKVFFYDLQKQSFFSDVRQNSKLSKSLKLDEKSAKIFKKYQNQLNPLIANLLIMDSFDFNTEVNVNILGHIFEQSISDLEEIKEEETSRRKKEGVFYTPEYITDFICTNTIIPYLSKSNITTIDELILEYENNFEELEEKIKKIKILDPACGSGAFLIKAANLLLEINNIIKEIKNPPKTSSPQLEDFTRVDEIKTIIENNIFGVDINKESIEITKLSLYLKMASPDRKLSDLSKNIRVGNSLIDDKLIDETAFNWKKQFKEVFENGGFDIIIGNPPYIKNQYLDYNHIDWFKKHKETAHGRIDASGLFFELAKNLLRKDGVVSYIISNQFLISEYGRKTRKYFLEKFKILAIVDFGDLQVFEDASTYVGIFNLRNSKPSDFNYLRISRDEFGKIIDLSKSEIIDLKSLSDEPWILENQKLIEKIAKNKKLKQIGGYVAGIVTGDDDVLLFDSQKLEKVNLEKEILHPILEGTDPDRYMPIKPKNYVIYPYKLQNGKTVLIDEEELSKKYPRAYDYLKKNKNKLSTRKDSRREFGGTKWYGLVRFGLLENYNRERIVSSGEVKEHVFTIDKTKSSHLYARVISIKIDDKNYDIHYVLGLLNSKIVRFYYQHSGPKKQRGYFSLTSSFVNKIPLSLGNEKLQIEIILNVKEILSLNHLFDEKCLEFLELLEINYKIKINNKIRKFYEMEFSDLINEFNKQKIDQSIETQAKLRSYFNSVIHKTKDIQEQVKLKENKINALVYEVYNINKEEQEEIREFLER